MSKMKSPDRATIGDVARLAGVSISTVSRVINQSAPVAPELEAKVKTTIAELNYRPRAAAQILAGHKTNILGLLLPKIGLDFYPLTLHGIEREARQNGFGLLIYSTGEDSPATAMTPLTLREHNTDGLLVFPNSLPDAELIRLRQLHFPVVLIHRSPPDGLDIPCVTVENNTSARQLVNHLIEAHNYRRIAFLAGPEGHEDSCWREKGYREALAAHNIPFDPTLIAQGDFDKKKAQAAVSDWLARKPDIDAIFAGDDGSAIGAMSALNQAGKRIPQDIAVVGFDDIEISRYLTPSLTTVHAPIEQAGHEATRQLVQLIRTGQAEPLVLLPTKLVIRRSCGCA